jgi:Lantibiotic dehydratase, N terminus
VTVQPRCADAGAAAVAARWRTMPLFMLRQSGFPFELLGRLGAPEVARAAAALLDAAALLERDAERAKAVLRGLAHADPAAWAHVHGELSSRVGRGLPLPPRTLRGVGELEAWNRRCAEVAKLEERLDTAVEDALATTRRAIVETFRDDDRLREALFLSNETGFATLDRWLTHADGGRHGDGAKADTLAMYLQRFCAKSETVSHFGPLTAGRFDEDAQAFEWNERGPLERRTFFTHWAANELAAALTADPELGDLRRPRRRPGSFLDGDVLDLYALEFHPHWSLRYQGQCRLDTEELALLEACDGERTVGELRASWNARFDEVLVSLTRKGALLVELEVPVGVFDPLAALRDLLPPGTRQRKTIESLRATVRRFQAAPLEERRAALGELHRAFREQTGSEPSRGQGEAYADRSLLFEEAHSGLVDFRAGPEVRAAVEDALGVVYDLALLPARRRLTLERGVLERWFVGVFGSGAREPLGRVLGAARRDRHELVEASARVAEAVTRVNDEIAEVLLPPPGQDEHVHEVDRGRIDELLAGWPREPRALCNPDVSFVAESVDALAAGDFHVLVGDFHAVRELLSHSSVSALLSEAEPALASWASSFYADLVEPDEAVVDVIRVHNEKTRAQVELEGFDVEAYGRSPKPRAQVLALDELELEHDGERLELRSRRCDEALRVTAPPVGGLGVADDVLAAFAFPRTFSGAAVDAPARSHLPRLVSGRVILQRELWRVGPEDLRPAGVRHVSLDPEAAGALAVERLRRRLELPRHVFAKIPGQPKPIYVDLEAPLLVRQLLRLSRGAETVELTEMLPRPGQLWLEGPDGHHTSELRFAVFDR